MRIKMYEHEHRRQPSVTAIAQLLSTILYNKRFFPYYTFNLLAGIDDEGSFS
jgi:20S proteasome subunit beta 6